MERPFAPMSSAMHRIMMDRFFRSVINVAFSSPGVSAEGGGGPCFKDSVSPSSRSLNDSAKVKQTKKKPIIFISKMRLSVFIFIN